MILLEFEFAEKTGVAERQRPFIAREIIVETTRRFCESANISTENLQEFDRRFVNWLTEVGNSHAYSANVRAIRGR